MDIREVTKALQDATDTLEKMIQAMGILTKQNALLTEEVARLKLELSHWEGTYGAQATSI